MVHFIKWTFFYVAERFRSAIWNSLNYLRSQPQPHLQPQPNTRRSPLHRLQLRSHPHSRDSLSSFSRSRLSAQRFMLLPQPQPHPQPHLRRGSSRVAVTGQEQPQPVLDPLFIFSGKVVKSLSNPQHIFIFPHLFILVGFPTLSVYARHVFWFSLLWTV